MRFFADDCAFNIWYYIVIPHCHSTFFFGEHEQKFDWICHQFKDIFIKWLVWRIINKNVAITIILFQMKEGDDDQ